MYSQHSINENRKRPIPSNASTFPSKRSQRLSSVMDRLNLNNDDVSSVGPQRTVQNYDLSATLYTQSESEQLQSVSGSSISLNNAHRPSQQNIQPFSMIPSLREPIESELLNEFNGEDYRIPKKFPSDPRNNKDGDTQRRYLSSITEYLNKTDYKASSPPRHIRLLNSKDFHTMLKHTILRLDPTYRPKRKFEDEVLDILKRFNYPLRETISPKSLLSIGAIHSNPTFFALLHWMVQCCRAMDVATPEDYQEATQFEMSLDTLFQLYHEYAAATYHLYMSRNDDHSVPYNELSNALDKVKLAAKKQVYELEVALSGSKEKKDQLMSFVPSVNDVIKKNQELARDLGKFKAFCEEKKKKTERFRSLNERVNNEIIRLQKEQQSLHSEEEELKAKLKGKNIAVNDIKSMRAKHEADEQKCADLMAHLEDHRQLYSQKVEILNKLKDKVRKEVDEFNSRARKLFSHGPHSRDIPISYNPNGTTVEEMTSININETIIPKLENLEQDANNEFANVTAETQMLRESLEISRTTTDQSRSDLILMQKDYDSRKKKYEESHQKFMQENEQFNNMVDKRERAVEEERSEARGSVIQAKQRIFAQEKQLKEMNRTFQQEREALEYQVAKYISQVDENQHKLISSTENLLKVALSQNAQLE